MLLRSEKIPLRTGGVPIAVISHHDATMYDLHPGDRVSVSPRASSSKKRRVSEGFNKELVMALDISDDDRRIKKGRVGLTIEAYEELGLKSNELVVVKPAPKPKSLDYIKKKRSGKRLSSSEYDLIVKQIVDNELRQIEIAYFLAAIEIHGMSEKEIASMTSALVKNGNRLRFKKGELIVDKHCIGGVPNNRTTMIVVPIIAAAGLKIPKSSSRAITSPAGTADTMEALCNVNLSLDEIKRVVSEVGGCMVWGGSLGLAPADDKIIRVEKPLSIDAQGIMMSSVLAKKLSVGSTHVLIDIPYGRGAKVEKKADAEKLKKKFERIGRLLGINVKAVLTDGRAPIGNGVGPSLEAKDVIAVLKGDPEAPLDLREKSLFLAGEILNFTKVAKNGEGVKLARMILDEGLAYDKFLEIMRAQGGLKKLRRAKIVKACRAVSDGVVKRIDNKEISKIARIAGAPQTKEAGILLRKKVGDPVKKGDVLMEIHANNDERAKNAFRQFKELMPYKIK